MGVKSSRNRQNRLMRQQKWHPVKSAILTDYAILCWIVTIRSFPDAEAGEDGGEDVGGGDGAGDGAEVVDGLAHILGDEVA